MHHLFGKYHGEQARSGRVWACLSYCVHREMVSFAGDDRCPNCRGLPSHYLSYQISWAVQDDAGPQSFHWGAQTFEARRAVDQKTEAALKEAKRQVKEYRNEPETKACLKRVRDLETKTWRLEDRLSEKKRRLGLSNYDDGEFQLPHVVSSFY